MTLAKHLLLLVAPVCLALTSVAHADPLLQWTFETNLTKTVGGTTGITQTTLSGIVPEVNPDNLSATFGGVHNSGSTTKWYTGNGNGSATGLFSNGWTSGTNTDNYYEISADLSGYSNLSLSLDDTGSNTGPNSFKIQVSTDGTQYDDVPSATFTIPTFAGASKNFSPSAAEPLFTFTFDLSNYSHVEGIRIVDIATRAVADSSSLGAGGTNRIDNVTLTGTAISAVPEPSSLGLLGAASLLLFRKRRQQTR